MLRILPALTCTLWMLNGAYILRYVLPQLSNTVDGILVCTQCSLPVSIAGTDWHRLNHIISILKQAKIMQGPYYRFMQIEGLNREPRLPDRHLRTMGDPVEGREEGIFEQGRSRSWREYLQRQLSQAHGPSECGRQWCSLSYLRDSWHMT